MIRVKIFKQLNDECQIKILDEDDEELNVDIDQILNTNNTLIFELEGLQLKRGRKKKDV